MKCEVDVSRNSQFIWPCRKILFCCIRKMESEKSREDKPSLFVFNAEQIPQLIFLWYQFQHSRAKPPDSTNPFVMTSFHEYCVLELF